MTPPDEVVGLAAKLSEAQRVAIIRRATSRGIANRLLRKGLVRTTEAHDGIGIVLTLSAAGLALRAHLTGGIHE